MMIIETSSRFVLAMLLLLLPVYGRLQSRSQPADNGNVTIKISIPVVTTSNMQRGALQTMVHANQSEQEILINDILDILREVNVRHNLEGREEVLREIAEKVVSTGNIRPERLSLEARLLAMKIRITTTWKDLNELTDTVTEHLKTLLGENKAHRSKRHNCNDCTNCCNSCFPARASVRTDSGERKALHALKVGEKVSCLTGDGQEAFCDVIGFLHKQENGVHEYLAVHTTSGHRLELSPSHLIFRSKQRFLSVLEAEDVFASKLTVGDYVYVKTEKGLESSMITRISASEARGFYAPLTSEGTVIVDGVLASCFAQFDSHKLAQLGMTGARMAYYYAPTWLQSYLLGADKDGLMAYAKHLTPLVSFFMGDRFYDSQM